MGLDLRLHEFVTVMANSSKPQLLSALAQEFGQFRKLTNSQSLFSFGNDALWLYFRYSKVHPKQRTFFGLREADLRQLEGRNAFICFVTDSDEDPVFIPFVDFEEVFHSVTPANDGQYKVQLARHKDADELYIARAGRFNVEAYRGLEVVRQSLERHHFNPLVDLSHQQVQTLLAGIGHAKGYDVYVPCRDAIGLDWSLTTQFRLREAVPSGLGDAATILQEVDVVWLTHGSNDIQGLLEVEHSTPIYSGLLRFNDLLLAQPSLTRFHIVSNDSRRELFSRQVTRMTFKCSGLAEIASFLDYANVVTWHERVRLSGALVI
jgi:hypothetical protein